MFYKIGSECNLRKIIFEESIREQYVIIHLTKMVSYVSFVDFTLYMLVPKYIKNQKESWTLMLCT